MSARAVCAAHGVVLLLGLQVACVELSGGTSGSARRRPDVAASEFDASSGAADAGAGAAVSTALDSASPPPLSGGPWRLVWQDEFDGDAGSAPDPAKWKADIGGDGWGNEQLEFDTGRTDNAALDGAGHLAIVARKEAYQGRPYTSARINTSGRFERAYGRFEARLQLPSGAGIWPAFWLLGNDVGKVGWPDCGEIDVMENRGQDPSTVRGSLHGPGYSGGDNLGVRHTVTGESLAQSFHIYAVEWEPTEIRFYVDNARYNVVRKNALPSAGRWVFDHPFFLILNVAVGGTFVGSPDGTTRFPQTMLVDFVRAYEKVP